MPRWIQNPEPPYNLIPAEEYVRPKAKTHMVMEDVKPFKSPIDGSVIGTRHKLEEHNRRHGVTNSADYPKEWVANRGKSIVNRQKREGNVERRELIQKALYDMERK